MAGPHHRRFWVLLIAASVAMACWRWIPGCTIDRLAFSAVSHGSTNPPFFITGNGSHDNPWKLRTFSPESTPDPGQAPVMVSLGDDLGGVFQSSPLSPIDFAVILTNIHRLGVQKAATAAVLAWESSDPIGLAALDKAISRFDTLVMAAPLSRGALPETMPQPFRKASIPLTKIKGITTNLPLVNRISLPNVILGAENSSAGFQSLDSEPDNGHVPMLARWGDRAVFAFPLLVAMQTLDLPLEAIEVKLGESIKLSANGPIVPIDHYGRLSLSQKKIPPLSRIPAELLIDGGADLLPMKPPHPVILRDDRSAAEASTRAFSTMIPGIITSIISDGFLTSNRACIRPQPQTELLCLSLVVILLAAFCKRPAFSRNIVFLIIAGICVAAQCVAANLWIWLPGLASMAAVAAAWAASMVIGIGPKTPDPSEPPAKPTEPAPPKTRKTTTPKTSPS